MAIAEAFKNAAKILGWRWSPAHDGLIHESYLKPGFEPHREGGYIVAVDSEDACSLSGIDTEAEAAALVSRSAA